MATVGLLVPQFQVDWALNAIHLLAYFLTNLIKNIKYLREKTKKRYDEVTTITPHFSTATKIYPEVKRQVTNQESSHLN